VSDTQERPVSQLVKRDCKCWHAAFLRIMADGATELSDRDDAERLWPETREALREIADALQASEEREQRLRALCAAREREARNADDCPCGCPACLGVHEVRAILGSKP
jgi:phosphoglycolate phosphatase-like HAD superfamily hydrolase